MQFVITVGQLDAAKLNVPAEIFYSIRAKSTPETPVLFLIWGKS